MIYWANRFRLSSFSLFLQLILFLVPIRFCAKVFHSLLPLQSFFSSILFESLFLFLLLPTFIRMERNEQGKVVKFEILLFVRWLVLLLNFSLSFLAFAFVSLLSPVFFLSAVQLFHAHCIPNAAFRMQMFIHTYTHNAAMCRMPKKINLSLILLLCLPWIFFDSRLYCVREALVFRSFFVFSTITSKEEEERKLTRFWKISHQTCTRRFSERKKKFLFLTHSVSLSVFAFSFNLPLFWQFKLKQRLDCFAPFRKGQTQKNLILIF